MLLSELTHDPDASRRYLERYVNDGSPSGFSTIHTTQRKTSPFEITQWFHPLVCFAPPENFRDFGYIPTLLFPELYGSQNWIIVHPDMKGNPFFRNPAFELKELDALKVVPTASGRTVQIINRKEEDYVKLHYDGILGRITRELPFEKAISGPEISSIIIKAIDSCELDPMLSILPETGARILINSLQNDSQWGMVWRQSIPYGLNTSKYHFFFPSFAFFSSDQFKTHQKPLLIQVINHFGYDPISYLLDVIIFPLIKSYFSLIQKLGLQAELNSQNLLLGFNKTFSECHFIIRDLESVDKDITLMDSIGKWQHFASYPYKCIEKKQYNYAIKHSFMYDFKLGESILQPLINALVLHFKVEENYLREKIKEFTAPLIQKLPEDFFPKNKWYVFAKVLVDQSKEQRPYIEYKNPKFRN